jgi:hypothetical protein
MNRPTRCCVKNEQYKLLQCDIMANANFEFPEISSGLDNFWSPCMMSLLKSTVLSVGLVAGLAATANAQSGLARLPDGSTPPSYDRTLQVQNAHTGIAGSTQSFYPKPGGGAVWTEGHDQSAPQSVTGAYPSRNETGPKPH